MANAPAMLMLTLALAWCLSGAARADAIRAAVFDIEFDDTSLEGATAGSRPDEQARLAALDSQLRDSLAGSGQYRVVDIAPVSAAARSLDLRTCDGCDVDLAKQLGAEVSVTGWVQKVSNLILNINLVVRDVNSGHALRAGSVDIRGNTDESWRRGLTYLLKHRIFDPASGTAR